MFSTKHSVYSTPEPLLLIKAGASHLARSHSARGEPRFSHDRTTCLALLILDVPYLLKYGS